jgi:hypothetical protein
MSQHIMYATFAVCFLYALGGIIDYQQVFDYLDEQTIGPWPLSFFFVLPTYPLFFYYRPSLLLFFEQSLEALLKAVHAVCEHPWLPSILYALAQLLLAFLVMVCYLLSLVFASPVGSIARWFGSGLAARFNLAMNRRGSVAITDVSPETPEGSGLRERFREQHAQFDSLRERASQHFHRVQDAGISYLSTRTRPANNVDFSPLHLTPLHSPELLPAAVELLSVPLWKQLLFGVDCIAKAEKEIIDHLFELADRNDTILRAHETTLQSYAQECDKMIHSIEERPVRRPRNPFSLNGAACFSQRTVRPERKIKIVSESYYASTWWLDRARYAARRPVVRLTSELRYCLPADRVAALASGYSGQALGQQG